jgi:pilus assembly protein CpaC
MRKRSISTKIPVPVLFIAIFVTAFGISALAQSTSSESGQAQKALLSTPGGSSTLRVLVDKSMVINSPTKLKRVAVTNEKIASAIIVTPNQILVHGLLPGVVSLLIWNEQEQMQPFDLEVQMDLGKLRKSFQSTFPKESIQVSQSAASILLSGTVSTPDVVDKAIAIAKTESSNVVSILNAIPAVTNQVVMLQVKFAEVDRNAVRQFGINLFSTGALNTPGTITTGQFSPLAADSVTNTIGSRAAGFKTEFQLTDLLNIFVFRPDLNMGVMIKALEQQNLLQILAEPNLLAMGGKEASFLAGGEFPVPIVQGGSVQTVSVQFKEFGIRLRFVASPSPDGAISLKVAPEVSALDYSNAVTLAGFLIPALTTRRAETEVQLRDGQSFAIAGLLDNRVIQQHSKIPWLGDVPLLGKLFQSTDFRKSKTELLVMVTPKIVQPVEPGQTLPGLNFPAPFMDSDKFDGKAGEAPPAGTTRP